MVITAPPEPNDVTTIWTLPSSINERATLIVVEHDMQFIRMIATRVTVFDRGSILLEDTMDVVAADPRVREVYLGHKPH